MAFTRRLTTNALIEETRQLIDESNTADVQDAEILASLNRGQDRVASVLARHYNPPLLTSADVTIMAGQTDYDIPDAAFEGRLLKVEFSATEGIYQRLEPIGISDIDLYEDTSATGTAPYYFCQIGNQYRLIPAAPNFGSLRIWYCRDVEPLVQEQGRITLVNAGSRYVMLDEPGDELSTSVDDLESYVNLVDKDTGAIKATMQIQSIVDRKVTFRGTPTRSTVQGRTVTGTLPSTVEADDYIAPIAGTCVPFMRKPAANYILQYAAADIAVTKLGAEPGILMAQVSKMEEDVQRSWSGRPNTIRVRNRSNNWRRNPRAGVLVLRR